MSSDTIHSEFTFCPSAPPHADKGVVIGVIGGTVESPRVGYLAKLQPITNELLSLAKPVSPTEVFRFAAPCAGDRCQHFDGMNCRLAQRIVRLLPEVVGTLPPCRLRPHCQWWRQEGTAACLRCPQIVTETQAASAHLREAAEPPANERQEATDDGTDREMSVSPQVRRIPNGSD